MKPDSLYQTLVELSDTSFPVYVSEGTQRQARVMAERCRHAYDYLSATLDFKPQIRVLILAPEDWHEYAGPRVSQVYGMPHTSDEQTLVVAGEDNSFWQSMTPPVNALPALSAEMMHVAYGLPSGEINLSLFFDLLAIHEMAHLFHYQAIVKFPRLWIMELFCNLCLHTYVAVKEPDLLPALETFPAIVIEGGMSHLRYHSLQDFERFYVDVGPQNYGWYQSRLHVASKNVFNAGGVETLRRLWNAFKQPNGPIRDDELELILSDEVHPAMARVLSQWPS